MPGCLKTWLNEYNKIVSFCPSLSVSQTTCHVSCCKDPIKCISLRICDKRCICAEEKRQSALRWLVRLLCHCQYDSKFVLLFIVYISASHVHVWILTEEKRLASVDVTQPNRLRAQKTLISLVLIPMVSIFIWLIVPYYRWWNSRRRQQQQQQ